MSETQTATSAPAAEPVMASANEATIDPVRTNASKDLTPESRPEVTAGAAASAADTTATTGAVDDVPKGMAVVESQPINEGVLAYKQPGLVKYEASSSGPFPSTPLMHHVGASCTRRSFSGSATSPSNTST